MEDERIDFRPHMRLILKRWALVRDLVVVAVLISMIPAFILPALSEPMYVAKGYVRLDQYRAQVIFDKTIITASQNDTITQAASAAANTRLNSLVELVRNPQIATVVAEKLGGTMSAGNLLDMVSGQSIRGTDLIEISVTASEPTLAVALVNTWTTQYYHLINQLYTHQTGANSNVEQQIAEAKLRLDKAQSTFNDFVRTSQTYRLTQRLGALNIGLAFLTGSPSKEIAEIPREFTDIPAELRTVKQIAGWYQSRTRLQALHQNALALQAQIEGGGDSASLSSELTQIMLKTQAFGTSDGAGGIPGSLQLQWGGSANPQRLEADVKSLVLVIENQMAQVDSRIKNGLQALLPGSATRQNSSSEQLVQVVVDKLNDEMSALQGQLDFENRRSANLLQEVELTGNTYKALVQKREEQNAARAFPDTEVRIVSTSTDASLKPKLLAQRAQTISIAVILALVVGLLAIYVFEGLAPEKPTPTLRWIVRLVTKST